MPQINPHILRWARETASLSLDEAAKALDLGRVHQSGVSLLQAYEDGHAPPSRPLLLKMAKIYHRPLLVFYLPKPPKRGERGEDFRTLPADRRSESAGLLDALVRDVHVRQRLVRTTLEEAEEASRLPFVGSIKLDWPIADVCKSIAAQLQFDLALFRREQTIEKAFNYLRHQVEHAGIFVLLISNLGSYHSTVSADVFRGFALADDVAPFIVVNDQDARVAWSVTVLHELTHIWLGQTGISGGEVERDVERFCNDVASQLLLPDCDLKQWSLAGLGFDGLIQEIGSFADARKISCSMVAYRLFQSGSLSQTLWRSLSGRFRERCLSEKRVAKHQKEGGGGPNYYTVRRHRLGDALVNLVQRTLAEGILTPTKASRVLGIHPMLR